MAGAAYESIDVPVRAATDELLNLMRGEECLQGTLSNHHVEALVEGIKLFLYGPV